MLDNQLFKTVVDSAPLVSIDILLSKDNKVFIVRKKGKKACTRLFLFNWRQN